MFFLFCIAVAFIAGLVLRQPILNRLDDLKDKIENKLGMK